MSVNWIEPERSNESLQPDLGGLIALRISRRELFRRGGAGLFTLFAGCAGRTAATGPLLGFRGVPPSTADRLVVPPGYSAQVLYAWGDPAGIGGAGPAFRFDASNSAAEQALQAGMHHDAIEFFALPAGLRESGRGLLCINHEYTAEALLHADGAANWSAEKTAKSQNAHGVSVIEVECAASGEWRVVRPSRFARRITAATPMRLSGPAAGHALLRTAADPAGFEVLGTLNNCAGGRTPWGTYLTCEENFNGYFVNAGTVRADERRYGIGARARARWHETDARFDAARHPNEPHRFGWVVEIDPFNPASPPVKLTALGRCKHEAAMTTLARDGRVVVYMGDDEGFEYIYKFVSDGRFDPRDPRIARELLDRGTLHVARFAADGSGEWLPLVHGRGPLTAANGFPDQAAVLVRTRQAADALGATPMDRPEWVAVHPSSGEVYCSLTNNAARGQPGRPGADAANPRNANRYGQIVRWREAGGDAASTSFRWDLFLLAGDPASVDPAVRGTQRGDAFGSPDGLWCDARGVLWIQTDASQPKPGTPDHAAIGNNQMLAADPATGEVRRFLVGPPGCEVTGATATPDGRSLFVNIQHPGEGAASQWPDYRAGGRPRSATVVIRRDDGGVVGT